MNRANGSDRARRGSLLQVSSVWVAVASTVVVFAALALIIVNAPGWPKVKHAFFDPAEFRVYFGTVGHAFVLNIKIFLVAEVLILTLAMVLAVLRSLPGPVFLPIRLLAVIGYTDLFRGIPTILLVLLFGFGIPTLQLSHVTKPPAVPWVLLGPLSSTRRTRQRVLAAASTRCTPARRRRPGRWA